MCVVNTFFSIVNIKFKEEKSLKFSFLGYIGYIITKIFDTLQGFTLCLDKLETTKLKDRLSKIPIKKPIFIMGLARAGTTIMLEMLSKHPYVATHQYKHLIMPYLPHTIDLLIKGMYIQAKPAERVHQDGIIIDHDSPEVVEEIFWQKFFKQAHNELISNILTEKVQNSQFELFYKTHIRKLLLSQNSSRYLTKNNYNITRMEYLLKLFPDAKFIIMIRNPVKQIASLIKQMKLFMKFGNQQPLFEDWLGMIGHHEFGIDSKCINVQNTEMVNKIRKLWNSKNSYVRGWAYYWNSIYAYIENLLKNNQQIKNTSYIVKYDDLCCNSAILINELLNFLELPSEEFGKIKQYYTNHLKKPTYYHPDFSKSELSSIMNITGETAKRFGIDVKN
jgi:hypothetical protein